MLKAVAKVPRETFVPDAHRSEVGVDGPIPIGCGQTTSQPSLIASMVEALGLGGTERVLEIGAGHGYQSALLGELAASVYAIERFEELADQARANLNAYGADNVEVRAGDGTKGLPEHAPYDAIIIAAAHTEIPEPLTDQLTDGGRLIQPIGPSGMEDVTLFERRGEAIETVRVLAAARFVGLYGRHGLAAEG